MLYRKIKLNKDLTCEYSIDTLGVVINETTGVALKGTTVTKKNRYVKIHLDKFYPLHILVAKHFIDNLFGFPQVNHIDGDRYNNAASNLEWNTSRMNVSHAYRIGLKTNNGEKNPISILTEEDVISIWRLRNTKLTARQVRDKLKLSVGVDSVKSIRQGKNWSWLTSTLS